MAKCGKSVASNNHFANLDQVLVPSHCIRPEIKASANSVHSSASSACSVEIEAQGSGPSKA